MNECEKTAYATKSEVRKAKKSIRKKFHSNVKFYYCFKCAKWHLTTQKTDLDKRLDFDMRQEQFRQAIQTKQAEFLRRLSKKKTVWKIKLEEGSFVVTYNKTSKKSKINYYLSGKAI